MIRRVCVERGLWTRVAVWVFCGVSVALTPCLANEESDQVPSPYAPLEYLMGSWIGQAIPKERNVQRFRGWREKHTWAWVFQKGKPTGIKLTIEGSKTIASGSLTYDAGRKAYRLEATTPGPKSGPLAFEGTFDASGKKLELVQSSQTDDQGRLKVSLWPNSDFVRYTMTVDRNDPGGTRYSPVAEVGLTKEGETFAAGSSEIDRPKCIVTGAAAAMTVSYLGASYPICCTGCRDEFNENPEKYLKKAKLVAASATSKPSASGGASGGVSGVDDAVPGASTNLKAGGGMSGKAESSTAASTKGRAESATSGPAPSSTRAATLLLMGQKLEKAGNAAGALRYYRQIAKDFATTPAAKTAGARIRALEPK